MKFEVELQQDVRRLYRVEIEADSKSEVRSTVLSGLDPESLVYLDE